jgi:hypothetical protein
MSNLYTVVNKGNRELATTKVAHSREEARNLKRQLAHLRGQDIRNFVIMKYEATGSVR